MNYRAVIFDLDGTLLDTIDDIAVSANAALARHGFPQKPAGDYRRFIGDGMEMLIRRAVQDRALSDETVAALLADLRVEYTHRWHAATKPYPGIERMLKNLAGDGIALAVLSNKPHEFTDIMVRYFLPDILFRAVLGTGPDVPRKPDPTAALRIAAQVSQAPSNFVFLGDSANDMKAARSAGMFPAGALWGYRGREELIDGGAAVLLDSPDDMLKLFLPGDI